MRFFSLFFNNVYELILTILLSIIVSVGLFSGFKSVVYDYFEAKAQKRDVLIIKEIVKTCKEKHFKVKHENIGINLFVCGNGQDVTITIIDRNHINVSFYKDVFVPLNYDYFKEQLSFVLN